MKYFRFALICVLILVAGVVASACGNTQPQGEPKELVVSGYQTVYTQGEDFVTDGIAVHVLDGGIMKPTTDFTVDYSAFRKDVVGRYTITVALKQDPRSKATFTVEVKERTVVVTVESITLSGQTTEFTIPEKFVFDGVVTAQMSDGTQEQLTEYEVDAGDYDAMKQGSYDITVTASGKEASYRVSVQPRTTLRLLMIGNSFSDDASEYAPYVASSLGLANVEIGNLFIGGCNLQKHYINLLDQTASYDFRYHNGTSWDYTYGGKKQTLQYAIAFRDWDVISFQQASDHSGKPESYAVLASLMAHVATYATNDNVKFIFHMTWAYQQNSTHGAFPSYNNSQTYMYESIVNAVKSRVVTEDAIMAVVPNGTAIQNARTSYVGDNLTRDGYHLSIPLGRYIAALTLIGKLTGADLDTVTYAPGDLASDQVAIAKESAKNALATPYAVTQSIHTKEPTVSLEGLRELTAAEYGWTATTGFWNASDGSGTLWTNSELATKFVATKRFNKQTLPVGSVIVIDKGWKYRPDAWVSGNTGLSPRPENVTATYTQVTESWWSGISERAFNISTTAGDVLTARHMEAKAAFHIYVPA